MTSPKRNSGIDYSSTSFTNSFVGEAGELRAGDLNLASQSVAGQAAQLGVHHNLVSQQNVHVGHINMTHSIQPAPGSVPKNPKTPTEYYQLGASTPGAIKRGQVLILNYRVYQTAEAERHGTQYDASALKSVFTGMNFGVTEYTDKTGPQTRNILEQISCRTDHREAACLIVCILAHGNEEGFLCRDGEVIAYKNLYAYFAASKCQSLASKPKLFFIQACQGGSSDHGFQGDSTRVSSTTTSTQSNVTSGDSNQAPGVALDSLMFHPAPDPKLHPEMAHFYAVFCSFKGYQSYRDPRTGSLFIQSLCRILSSNWQTRNLREMVQLVKEEVAKKELVDSETGRSYKQMVYVDADTLLKEIRFN